MKLALSQLPHHLTTSLAPIYLVSGDTLFLVQEAVDTIRTAANRAGFVERVTETVESHATDWEKWLYTEAHSLSLFANKKIIELNLSNIKLNNKQGNLLEKYAKQPPADVILIIYTTKLDSAFEKKAWYQAIDKMAVVLPIWPVPIEQLPQWIMQRAKKCNVALSYPAAECLAERVEGNLFAAAQEIEKISLMQFHGALEPDVIRSFVTDHAQFDIFQLVDSVLLGNGSRALRILRHLAQENTEPALVLWAFTRELRLLSDIQKNLKQGLSLSSLFGKFRIWEKRQPSIRAFLQRHSERQSFALLEYAAKIDRLIKGIEAGSAWDNLQRFAVKIAGGAIIT